MGIPKRRERRGGRVGNLILDILLIAMLCALYAFTGSRDAQAVMASAYSAPIYRGAEKNTVALQFAVSWNAAALEDILDILKERELAVTFAVSGEWAEGNAALLCRMAAEGHELAVMGYSPLQDGTAREMERDVERALLAVAQGCGVQPTLYYSGARDTGVAAKVSRRLGLTHVQCTIDLLCARGSGVEIINRVSTGVIDGSIILAQPTAAAREALPGMLELLKQRGYAVTTTSGVIGE